MKNSGSPTYTYYRPSRLLCYFKPTQERPLTEVSWHYRPFISRTHNEYSYLLLIDIKREKNIEIDFLYDSALEQEDSQRVQARERKRDFAVQSAL